MSHPISDNENLTWRTQLRQILAPSLHLTIKIVKHKLSYKKNTHYLKITCVGTGREWVERERESERCVRERESEWACSFVPCSFLLSQFIKRLSFINKQEAHWKSRFFSPERQWRSGERARERAERERRRGPLWWVFFIRARSDVLNKSGLILDQTTILHLLS